jgi:hypothetical protein
MLVDTLHLLDLLLEFEVLKLNSIAIDGFHRIPLQLVTEDSIFILLPHPF